MAWRGEAWRGVQDKGRPFLWWYAPYGAIRHRPRKRRVIKEGRAPVGGGTQGGRQGRGGTEGGEGEQVERQGGLEFQT